jgi:hypothetical protein
MTPEASQHGPSTVPSGRIAVARRWVLSLLALASLVGGLQAQSGWEAFASGRSAIVADVGVRFAGLVAVVDAESVSDERDEDEQPVGRADAGLAVGASPSVGASVSPGSGLPRADLPRSDVLARWFVRARPSQGPPGCA